jgi:hypothetical protein
MSEALVQFGHDDLNAVVWAAARLISEGTDEKTVHLLDRLARKMQATLMERQGDGVQNTQGELKAVHWTKVSSPIGCDNPLESVE